MASQRASAAFLPHFSASANDELCVEEKLTRVVVGLSMIIAAYQVVEKTNFGSLAAAAKKFAPITA